jgi:hypothetical protein
MWALSIGAGEIPARNSRVRRGETHIHSHQIPTDLTCRFQSSHIRSYSIPKHLTSNPKQSHRYFSKYLSTQRKLTLQFFKVFKCSISMIQRSVNCHCENKESQSISVLRYSMACIARCQKSTTPRMKKIRLGWPERRPGHWLKIRMLPRPTKPLLFDPNAASSHCYRAASTTRCSITLTIRRRQADLRAALERVDPRCAFQLQQHRTA